MGISARQKAVIVAALIERDNAELTPYLCRELERVIAGDAARRERFMQKVRSPEYHWNKTRAAAKIGRRCFRRSN